MGEIKAVIFDVGGVLQLGDNSSLRHKKISKTGVHSGIARNLKISIDQYFDAIDTTYAKAVEGKISEEKAINILARNLGTTPAKLKNLYQKAYKKHFHINRELLNYAKAIKKKGYRISILSDQWWGSKKALITKELYRSFHPMIISCDVGLRKPNAKIYRLTLKELKIRPEESVFVDNQEWNTKAARNIGMKTVLFKNNKQAIKELKKILK